jgi:hypothetical protein
MQAEDLNVCNVLTSDFTTDQYRFRASRNHYPIHVTSSISTRNTGKTGWVTSTC